MPSGAHEYYEALGVPRAASPDEIRSAHRKLARQYHPDLHPGDKIAEDRFKKVQEAYDVLIDADARRIYDQNAVEPETGAAGDPDGTTGGGGTHSATDAGFFDRSQWMYVGRTGHAGLRDFYVSRSGHKLSEASETALAFLLACGIVGARELDWISQSPTVARLGWGGYRVFEPVAILFAMGFLLGGMRGNFLARCVIVNAVAWCCLVPYCWAARVLQWPDIVHTAQTLQWMDILHLLLWALPTHTPIIVGIFLRRGAAH